MLANFKDHIKQHFPTLFEEKILIACSGGLDSMTLVYLCQKLNLNIALAHCNFCLRANESDNEEAFILSFAKENDINIYSKKFDTQLHLENSKKSLQMLARELRYNWFYSLLELHQFDRILTAHHADDNLETFFINLTRGSGIDGLIGIPKQNGAVARPLLPFSRQVLLDYAKKNQIQWKQDSSNTSLKYQRNQLRQQLIPVFKELYPKVLEALATTQTNLKASKVLLENHIQDIMKRIVFKSEKAETHYDISALKSLTSAKLYLFPLFKRFGFSDWDELYNLMDAQSGKKILSKTHTLLKDRDFLILSDNKLSDSVNLQIKSNDKTFFLDGLGCNLKIENTDKVGKNHQNTAFFDADKLHFPLQLRNWRAGDYFYPKGMKGKKKIGKFFKDEKLSTIEKSRALLLCSDSQVVWVIGRRQDSRFVPDKNSISICKISLQYATD